MAKMGIKGIRKGEIFGLHHTIPYKDSKRMWKMLFGGSIRYKGVMIRKHLLNASFFPKLIREEWTMIVLIFSLILSIFNPLFLLIYLLAVFTKIRKQIKNRFFLAIFHRILQDITVFLSIIFFYPPIPNYNSKQIIIK